MVSDPLRLHVHKDVALPEPTMPSLADPDLAGLASLAQRPGHELRPLLLTLHAQAFAAAGIRDTRAVATFEALACGLIPLVTTDVLSEVAVLLATVPDAPDSVIRLLDRHLFTPDPTAQSSEVGIERGSIAGLVARERADIDLSLVANLSLRLDGHVLATLVGRACASDELARRLLARPELSTFDRATLYRAADAGTRDTIRDDLALLLAASARPPRPLSAVRRTRLIRSADRADARRLLRAVGAGLRLDPAPVWRLGVPEEAEFLALALTALDVPAEECGRIFLTVDPDLARSVKTVFRLMRVRRTTPARVAAYLVGAGPAFRRHAAGSGAASAKAAAKTETIAKTRAAKMTANARATEKAAAADPATRRIPDEPVSPAPARSRAASAPPGRRSRSTRDPDRT